VELELLPKDESGAPSSGEAPKDGPLVYSGPERRKQARRVTVDRREMIRFEDKPDRRSGHDRRVALKLWDGRDF
jgi:hypothetical protein